AFYGCTQLETVTFGANITKIGGSAFSHCSSLKEVMLPDTVTELGSWAFSNCTALEKLYIGTAITKIGSEAFKNCIALKSVFLPNSLLAFSPSNSDQPVFYGCNNLVIYTEVRTIPVIWSIHFGTYILKDYTYDEYLSITTNTEKSN
ncbi:MAG: leucine-rich repeat domain-containing protein, partial [Clostridia bacterium]|nr:leucine-rich repeat domain-containing protein [Clostridia bacterium]